MKGYGAVFAGIDAPITALTFRFVNNYRARFFGLRYSFFWAGKDTWSIYTAFASYCRVLDLSYPY
jgi:hypothetical protein